MLHPLPSLALEPDNPIPSIESDSSTWSWDSPLPEFVVSEVDRLRQFGALDTWRERSDTGGWVQRLRSGARISVDTQGRVVQVVTPGGAATRIEYRDNLLHRLVGPAEAWTLYTDDGLHWSRWEMGQPLQSWVGRIQVTSEGDIVYRYPSGVQLRVQSHGGRLVLDSAHRVRSMHYPHGLHVELADLQFSASAQWRQKVRVKGQILLRD